MAAPPDIALITDPRTYERGVPFDALGRLRRDDPVVWVEEPPGPERGCPTSTPTLTCWLRSADAGRVPT
jgi:hypothetical protein